MPEGKIIIVNKLPYIEYLDKQIPLCTEDCLQLIIQKEAVGKIVTFEIGADMFEGIDIAMINKDGWLNFITK